MSFIGPVLENGYNKFIQKKISFIRIQNLFAALASTAVTFITGTAVASFAAFFLTLAAYTIAAVAIFALFSTHTAFTGARLALVTDAAVAIFAALFFALAADAIVAIATLTFLVIAGHVFNFP